VSADLKQRLLRRYAYHEPKTFCHFESHSGAVDENAIVCDEDGDTITSGTIDELLSGKCDVRVLVSNGVSKRDAIRQLKKVLGWLQRSYDEYGEADFELTSRLDADHLPKQLPDFDPGSSGGAA
jgi:hypothetical protein